MNLEEMVKSVKEADGTAVKQALRRWDQVAKPLNSLGVLEEDIVRIAGASGTAAVDIGKKAIVVMCADNGIVAGNMAKGCSCVCIMARKAGADVIPIHVGIAGHDSIPGLLPRKVAGGTRNFLKGPSMSRGQALKAMETGIRTAFELKEKGYGLAGSGEMGIGNTTSSSAVLSVLLDQEPEKVTGRGAGLTTDGYSRKIQVIKDGIALHCPDRTDPVDVLAKVGGFDLAALAGFYIGCGMVRLPAVLDGLITGAAALAAVGICPRVRDFLLASHVSAEPAGEMVLEALGLRPAIRAGMCLGEGTGAAALFPLLDMAAAVYNQMSSFEEIQVGRYEHLV